MKKDLKILVIRFSSFGDIVLVYPFLNELRRLYPAASIDFLLKKEYADIIKLHPCVDNIFSLSDDIKNILKREKYDVVFNLQGNPKSIILSSNICNNVFKVRKDTFKKLILVNFKINILRNSLPVFAKYLKTLREFDPDTRLEYTLTENLKTDVPGSISGRYILVSPSSKHFTKRLPSDKFIGIINKLKFKIVLTGDISGTDEEICRYIASKVSNAENLCGKLSINELASYIQKSEFVICNDSGVMHLSEALNKKVFVFFGSSVKEFGFYPQLKTTEVFDSGKLNCRPCSHIGKNKCVNGHFKCMNDIDTDKAAERIKKFEDENLS